PNTTARRNRSLLWPRRSQTLITTRRCPALIRWVRTLIDRRRKNSCTETACRHLDGHHPVHVPAGIDDLRVLIRGLIEKAKENIYSVNEAGPVLNGTVHLATEPIAGDRNPGRSSRITAAREGVPRRCDRGHAP